MPKIGMANYLLVTLKIIVLLGCLFDALSYILNVLSSSLLYYGNALDKIAYSIIILTGLLYIAECVLLFLPNSSNLQVISTAVFLVTVVLNILIFIPTLYPVSNLIIGLVASILFILIKSQILFSR